jgi:mannose-6-phosphate isomerase-like protein (cupin superfamily)
MDLFTLPQLIAERARSQRPYLEFLRVPALSAGLYVLPADGVDNQQPHHEDEVYYVLQGRADMRVGSENQAVGPGTVIFVRAGVEHRFHAIAEELTVLVFFAPAESATTG